MSHDYEPSWDYPVAELETLQDITADERTAILAVVDRAWHQLAPAMGFTDGFDPFFVEPMGLTSFAGGPEGLAVYCNGTSSRPVVGFDLTALKRGCQEESLDLVHQFAVSLAHELAHAYQDDAGLEHGQFEERHEDKAEKFGRLWADTGRVNLSLLEDEQDALADLVQWQELFAAGPHQAEKACSGHCDAFARVFSEHLHHLGIEHELVVISRRTLSDGELVDENGFSHCCIALPDGRDLDARGLDASQRWEEEWIDEPGQETTFSYQSFPTAEHMMDFLRADSPGRRALKTVKDDPQLIQAWTDAFTRVRQAWMVQDEGETHPMSGPEQTFK